MSDVDSDAGGFQVLRLVWSAHLWGDLVFMLGTGTMGPAWLLAVLARRPSAIGGPDAQPTSPPLPLLMVVSFLAHWAVYALSWSFTMSPMAGQTGFLD